MLLEQIKPIRPDIITFTDPACDLNDYSKIHSIIDVKYKDDSEEEEREHSLKRYVPNRILSK